jgi:hypothetical protein
VESAFGGSVVSGGQFCGDSFDWNQASVAVKDFVTFDSVYKEMFECCSFSAIYKYNTAINCVLLQRRLV